ncbi:MAG: hypothetical protein BJ554DRAFT_186, partial [Olpidium bornovanus]
SNPPPSTRTQARRLHAGSQNRRRTSPQAAAPARPARPPDRPSGFPFDPRPEAASGPHAFIPTPRSSSRRSGEGLARPFGSMASAASHLANSRAVLAVFEKYQKERLFFVQTIADHASRESNIEVLQSAGVMSLLRPLLLDNVPAIQQAAALALGRLANYNEELAVAVVDGDILPQLVYSLSEQN